jgi:hypothetical protein
MRCAFRFALAVMAVCVPTFTVPASGQDGTRVRINQTVSRTVGSCTYTTTVRGSYHALATEADSVPVREAFIDVDAKIECRGAPPRTQLHQVYFARTTERELFDELASAARVDRADSGAPACSFEPEFARHESQAHIQDVSVACNPRVPSVAARGGGRRR